MGNDCVSGSHVRTLVILDNSLVFRVTIPDAASVQFKPPDDEHIIL